MIKAVIFDVDGTLLDTEHIYVEAWKKAGLEQGFEIPEEALRRTRAIDKKLAEQIFKSYVGEQFDYYETWKRRVRIAEEMIDAGAILLKPGAVELLDWLDENGYAKAFASMTGKELTYAHLGKAGLLERFSVRVTGDEVKNGKPAPDIFLMAAAQLGVSPEECIVCEDSYAGLQAAKNAGMLPAMIPDYVPAREEERGYAVILDSLFEVPGLIDTKNRETRA
ncbi:MAG: HAD family phosphatase [Clostridia bacterium]|nr:HAD family phosphatase [Clostridia bacterium]